MNIRNGVPLLMMLGAVAACGGAEEPEPPVIDEAPATPETPAATNTPAAPAGPAAPARAVLRNREGQEVGEVTFTQEGNEVVIVVNARNFEGGQKAIHIHDVGRCDGPTFESAGEHFNPGNTAHGLNAPGGPHAGDLPNLTIDPDDGVAHDTFRNDRVSLVPGAPNSLLGGDGTSIVAHVAADDNMSQPAGNSGDRNVCGVIEPAA